MLARCQSKGFSLIELAISMVIIGLLLGTGFAAFSRILSENKIRDDKMSIDSLKRHLITYAITHAGFPEPGDLNILPASFSGHITVNPFNKQYQVNIAPSLTTASTNSDKVIFCGNLKNLITTPPVAGSAPAICNHSTNSGETCTDSSLVAGVILSSGQDYTNNALNADAGTSYQWPGQTISKGYDDLVRAISLYDIAYYCNEELS